MDDLLPCPFCGDTESLYEKHMEGTVLHPAWKIVCDNCGASTAYTDTDWRDDWNERFTAESKNPDGETESEDVACIRCEFYMFTTTVTLFILSNRLVSHGCTHPDCFKPVTIHDPINGVTTSVKRIQDYDTLNAENKCKLYKEKKIMTMNTAERAKHYGLRLEALWTLLPEAMEIINRPSRITGDEKFLEMCAKISAPVRQHNLSPKDALMVLEVFGALADRGLRPKNILSLIFQSKTLTICRSCANFSNAAHSRGAEVRQDDECNHPDCFATKTTIDPIDGRVEHHWRIQNYDTLNAKNNCKLYKENI